MMEEDYAYSNENYGVNPSWYSSGVTETVKSTAAKFSWYLEEVYREEDTTVMERGGKDDTENSSRIHETLKRYSSTQEGTAKRQRLTTTSPTTIRQSFCTYVPDSRSDNRHLWKYHALYRGSSLFLFELYSLCSTMGYFHVLWTHFTNGAFDVWTQNNPLEHQGLNSSARSFYLSVEPCYSSLIGMVLKPTSGPVS